MWSSTTWTTLVPVPSIQPRPRSSSEMCAVPDGVNVTGRPIRHLRLHFNHLQPAGDLLDRDDLALPGPGADAAGALPVLGRRDVALPERPGAALRRADRVDGAPLPGVEEDAV